MRFKIAIIGIIISLLPGCKNEDGPLSKPDLSQRKAKVLATTGMIADIAQIIGGDRVEVECLMGPKVDPHQYVPKPSDLTKIRQADLVIYNGLHLEGKMTDIFEERAKKKWTLALGDGLPNLRDAEEGYEGSHDPHIWFDVRLWMTAVERVCLKLCELDQKNADFYKANSSRYLEQLNKLDSEIRTKLNKIPESKRVLITAHDAFGYFGRAYGIEVKGLQGVSTASDTGSKDIQELSELIGRRQIPAIFVETSVPSKGIEAVRQSVEKKYPGHIVRIAERELYSDALGEKGSEGETYIGMIRYNVKVIVEELAR